MEAKQWHLEEDSEGLEACVGLTVREAEAAVVEERRLGLPKAEAPGNGAVTNGRPHEDQGLANPFLFLNRLTAREQGIL